jgi:Yip1-like protein
MRKLARMAASHAEPEAARSLDKDWWLATLLVLQSPRSVFAALRDDSEAPASARAEPMAAIVFLAGISAFLSTSTAAHLFDDFEYDALLVLVEAIVAGALVGLQNYWLGGGALYLGARWLGSEGRYRRARHIVGFAMTPLVLSLIFVWPVALAMYGGDLFRSGGDDTGAGRWVFQALWLATVGWGIALLLTGVRTVHGWSWLRSIGAVGAAAAVLGATALAFAVL